MDVSFCRIAFPPHPSPPSSGGSKSSCWGRSGALGAVHPAGVQGAECPLTGLGAKSPEAAVLMPLCNEQLYSSRSDREKNKQKTSIQ